MKSVDAGRIGQNSIEEILARAEAVIEVLAKVPGVDGKNYGYLSIRRHRDGRVLLLAQIGECPAEKASKYSTLSLEKGQRLAAFAELGHVSSWQSRNESQGRWGGAIVANDLIFSFSGRPELADEAVCIATAVLCGDITLEEARQEIASISGNSIFENFVKLFFPTAP